MLNTLKSGQIKTETYPQITIEPFNPTEWPKTITIDYGTENYLCVDGRYRRGKLLITASNVANVENTVWDITFSDFFHNGHQVEGDQSVTYMGENENNNMEYGCTIVNGKIADPAGKVFFFEQETNREMIAGQEIHYATSGNIDDICGDEYLVTGIHSGVSSEGSAYTMNTEEPLHLNVCCKWIMEGKLAISLPDYNLDCQIDYRPNGDNSDLCNGEAAFSISIFLIRLFCLNQHWHGPMIRANVVSKLPTSHFHPRSPVFRPPTSHSPKTFRNKIPRY